MEPPLNSGLLGTTKRNSSENKGADKIFFSFVRGSVQRGNINCLLFQQIRDIRRSSGRNEQRLCCLP